MCVDYTIFILVSRYLTISIYCVFFLFQAISCLKRAIYLHPFNWIALYNLGLVHIYTRQYVSAFVFLSTSAKLNPNHAGTFMLIGCKSIKTQNKYYYFLFISYYTILKLLFCYYLL